MAFKVPMAFRKMNKPNAGGNINNTENRNQGGAGDIETLSPNEDAWLDPKSHKINHGLYIKHVSCNHKE